MPNHNLFGEIEVDTSVKLKSDGRKRYPSDLTDEEWESIQDLVPKPGRRSRPSEVDMRDVFDAIMYFLKTGVQWTHLPNDFPHHNTVQYYYDMIRDNLSDLKDLNKIKVKDVRKALRRNPEPSDRSN